MEPRPLKIAAGEKLKPLWGGKPCREPGVIDNHSAQGQWQENHRASRLPRKPLDQPEG